MATEKVCFAVNKMYCINGYGCFRGTAGSLFNVFHIAMTILVNQFCNFV